VTTNRTAYLAILALLWGATAASAQAPSAPLLNVSQGNIPNDTGSDGETKMTAEAATAWQGKALKVVFAAGDSFGDNPARVKSWKPFAKLQFLVNNPGKDTLALELNVFHRGTTNYDTRTVQPFEVKPGKNEIVIGINELKNVNGSAPDLANVLKWFISVEEGKSPTLFFSDIVLGDGAGIPAAAPSAGPAVAGVVGSVLPAASAYRVQGTVGDLKVDLTITPIGGAPAAQGAGPIGLPGAGLVVAPGTRKAVVSGDPTRLARIRALKMPAITKVVEFDTPEADAILSAMEIFPADNPWNLVISDWPLHERSKNMVASIGIDKVLRYNEDMCFIIVPPNQPKVDVKLLEAASESDPGPYPVPANTPIEGYPKAVSKDGKKRTLAEIQRRPAEYEDDRHAIVVDPTNGKLYEFFTMGKEADGKWASDGEATFNLKSNSLRPDGWTSADAAGLPMFPAVVRFDELKRGEIEHALRFTIRRSKKEYVYPATHFASNLTDDDLPRMGERFRLRKDFDISTFTPTVQTILKALKKYGMFVADNGLEWALSISPDPRIPAIHEELRKVKGADFEVVTFPAGYQPPQ